MTESLMTDQAATTTEGAPASQDASSTQPTGGEQQASQQQADSTQNQQAGQDGQKTGNAESDKAGDTSKQGAPEAYEFKPPEGQQFDPEVMNSFSEIAKELNLPQDAAQKMVDKVAPKILERQMQALETVRNEWAESARTDKEFGGEKLNDNLVTAKKALDAFGSPELRQLLNESGLGNHPEMIRLMYRAGKAISEDRFVGGTRGGQKSGPKGFNDLASALYSNQQT
jgi:hypothetical protein